MRLIFTNELSVMLLRNVNLDGRLRLQIAHQTRTCLLNLSTKPLDNHRQRAILRLAQLDTGS